MYGWALHSLLLGDHHCTCSSLVFTLRTGFFSADLLSGDHFNVLNDPFPGFSPRSTLTFAAYAVNALGISSVTQLVSTYEMNGTSMFRSGFKLGNGYATYFPTSVPLTAKRKPLKNGTLVFAVTLVSTTTPVTVQYSGILSNPPKWVSSVPPVPPSPPSWESFRLPQRPCLQSSQPLLWLSLIHI